MNEKRCENCRYFVPMFFHVGRCSKSEGTNMGAKMFTDDGKARILVNISFGCIQWETPTPTDGETL